MGGSCGCSQAPLLSWWLWSFWDEEVVQKLYPYEHYPESAVSPPSEVKPLLKEVLGYEIRWSSFREHFGVLKSTDIGINVAVHVGRNTVRAQVVGRDYGRAKPEDVGGTKKLAEEAVEAGAIGLSTGLDYEPGAYADAEELVELNSKDKKEGIQILVYVLLTP